MIFETKKSVEFSGGSKMDRFADVTVPDASVMFPSIEDSNALKLIQKAINAQGRANAGNALRSLSAGMDAATEARFKSVQTAVENLSKVLSGDSLLHALGAIWSVPENQPFQAILNGSAVPKRVSYELTAEQVLKSLESSDDSEAPADSAPTPQGKA